MTKKKIIILLLAGLLLIAILAALIFALPLLLNRERDPSAHYTPLRVAAPREVIDYYDANGITAFLEEKAEVNIIWVDYGEASQTSADIPARVAKDTEEGNAPDAYLGLGLTLSDLEGLAPGAFMNLTDLIGADTPEFQRVINDDTSRLGEMQINGQIYSFPSFYEHYSSEYPQKAWINEKWLSKLGLSMPSTPEELFDVLTRFKDDDPNGNGQRDEIPLAVAYDGLLDSGFGFIINAFITSEYDLSDTAGYINIDDNGRLYTAVTTPEFCEALKYIQRLFLDGLVPDNCFELGSEFFLSGGIGNELFGVVAGTDIAQLFNDVARAADYVPLPPLDGGNVATKVSRGQVLPGGFMVAKDTPLYKEALRLGDAALSMEGTLTTLYGSEGIGWGYADNRIQSMGGYDATWKAYKQPLNRPRAALPLWMPASLLMSCQATPEEDGSVNLKTDKNWQGYLNLITREVYEPVGQQSLKNMPPELLLYQVHEDRLAELGNAREEIYSRIVEGCRSFVLGGADIDGEFPLFVDELNALGLPQLLDILQQAVR